jgi:phosphomannomutase
MSNWLKKQGVNGFVDLCIMLIATIVAAMMMQPHLIFSNSIPTGGDYGGHLEVPHYLLNHLIPNGQIFGWSPDWYNGWPINIFYFPLPALIISLLSIIIPYVVAFKLVVAIGPILLPFAIWLVGRSSKLPHPMSSMMAVAMVSYLINQSYQIDGGNIFSTMAGEYSFSISLLFSLFYFASLVRWYRSSKGAALTAILFILATMSHLLGALLCIVATLVAIIVFNKSRVYFSVFLRTLLLGVVASATMAFWALNFAFNLSYTTNMGYSKVTNYYSYLIPNDYRWVILVAFLGVFFALFNCSKYEFCLAMLGLCGVTIMFGASFYLALMITMAVAILPILKKRPVATVFMVVGVVSALLFRYLPADSKLFNERLLPTYALAIYALAGLGLAEIAILVAKGFKSSMNLIWPEIPVRRNNAAKSLVALVIGAVSLFIVYQTTFDAGSDGYAQIPLLGNVASNSAEGWVNWNFTGYQAKPSYNEYVGIMNKMNKIGQEYGCGRAFWEYSAGLDRFGTPMALMLLPYFTNNCIDSEEGLFFESSATTPFHFLNQAELSAAPDEAMVGLNYDPNLQDVSLGVKHLQLMGVKYLMVSSEEINQEALINPSLTLLGRLRPHNIPPAYSPPSTVTWYIYEVANSSLVTPLSHNPVVLTKIPSSNPATIGSWTTAAQSWYLSPSDWRIEVASNGPAYWSRINYYSGELASKKGVNLSKLTESKLPSVKITDLKSSLTSISFNVNRINVPVDIKISYFPNFHAVNALGPYRIFPNQMVVIPTGNHVTVYFGATPINWLEYFISGIGLIGLVLIIKMLPKNRKFYSGSIIVSKRGKALLEQQIENLDKIFKAYDIRGLCPQELDESIARVIGYSFAKLKNSESIVVARDMRPTGEMLVEAFCEGVTATGTRVIDIGMASTDMLYFASGVLDMPGAMFTASHNPAQYNGIKLCGPKAAPIGEATGLKQIKQLCRQLLPTSSSIEGDENLISTDSLLEDFIVHVQSFIDLHDFKGLRIIADTANGMGGLIVPVAFSNMDVELEILYPELDGTFPNHPADPIQEENQQDLIQRVLETEADVGLAFDGDADRVFLVDDEGKPLSGSLTTALVAQSMLKKYPGSTILHNLICSKVVRETIESNGGIPIRTRVGHSFIKETMAETGALFGGEHSGHYYFRDNFRADSGLIAAFVVLELIYTSKKKLSELRKPFEKYFASGEKNVEVINVQEVLSELEAYFSSQSAEVDKLDGLTVDYGSWWVNIRPSNTEPLLRINVEADSIESMNQHLTELLNLIKSISDKSK